jgi:hypothetical protein
VTKLTNENGNVLDRKVYEGNSWMIRGKAETRSHELMVREM